MKDEKIWNLMSIDYEPNQEPIFFHKPLILPDKTSMNPSYFIIGGQKNSSGTRGTRKVTPKHIYKLTIKFQDPKAQSDKKPFPISAIIKPVSNLTIKSNCGYSQTIPCCTKVKDHKNNDDYWIMCDENGTVREFCPAQGLVKELPDNS